VRKDFASFYLSRSHLGLRKKTIVRDSSLSRPSISVRKISTIFAHKFG
jgi:hypothetical protein